MHLQADSDSWGYYNSIWRHQYSYSKKPSSKGTSLLIQYIMCTVETLKAAHLHVVITKEVHPVCTHTCSHMRGLYRDFVYPRYRMCHRWWNLNCKIHIKLSYDGPSAAPSSFIESRLMHVCISRLTHICVKVSNRKRGIDRVHRKRRHIAKDRTLRQRMSIMLIISAERNIFS